MIASLIIGFSLVTMLAGLAMGTLAGGLTITPAAVFAGGLVLALLGARLREADQQRRAAPPQKGMWSARD